jgi:hypothetical protein
MCQWEFFMLILFMKGNVVNRLLQKMIVFTNIFLIDTFSNIEKNKIDYIKMNQNDLWTELYQGINEIVLRGDVQGSINRKIILPFFFKW